MSKCRLVFDGTFLFDMFYQFKCVTNGSDHTHSSLNVGSSGWCWMPRDEFWGAEK